MPSIDIRRAHRVGLRDARTRIERVAEHLAERFDVSYGWEKNTLHFERSGVDGHIAVTAKDIHVSVRLGFLLMAIGGAIEREIHRYLDEEFGAS
jgi:putative polyhydroxyalkanoate system protein